LRPPHPHAVFVRPAARFHRAWGDHGGKRAELEARDRRQHRRGPCLVSLRQLLASHEELARKLGSLEKKCDAEFEQVYDTIRALMSPPEEDFSKKDRIGFNGAEAS
jgi:hypothetical protein